VSTWAERGLHEWRATPPRHDDGSPSRALVLGGGGATGIAWLGGLIAGLRERGIDLREADTVIGTSAGSVVGAHLRLDTSESGGGMAPMSTEPIQDLGRASGGAGLTLIRALVHPSRAGSRALIGRISTGARTGSEEGFVELIAGTLKGVPWPERPLLVTAIDVEDGTAMVFSRDSGVPLDRALAASCSVPGTFPPVTIGGRRYMDGGVRSVANVDLAAGHDRVLVLAPIPLSFRPADAPARQARALRPNARTLVIAPDGATRRVIGYKFLDMTRTGAAMEAGHAQAQREAERIARTWQG
jgi:NTE family protein